MVPYSYTTYAGLSTTTLPSSYVTLDDELKKAARDCDIEQTNNVLETLYKKYNNLLQEHQELRDRVTLLEARFTTLQLYYYKRFEE